MAPYSRRCVPSSKSLNADAIFTPVPPMDGKVVCVFVKGECILLWPPYVSREFDGHCLRISARETWMFRILITSKRSVCQGAEPLGHCEERKSTKAVRKFAQEIFAMNNLLNSSMPLKNCKRSSSLAPGTGLWNDPANMEVALSSSERTSASPWT